MKVLIQLKPIINGVRVDGRQAWITKDDNGNLIVGNIYTTEHTAKEIDKTDMEELLKLQSLGRINIIEII